MKTASASNYLTSDCRPYWLASIDMGPGRTTRIVDEPYLDDPDFEAFEGRIIAEYSMTITAASLYNWLVRHDHGKDRHDRYSLQRDKHSQAAARELERLDLIAVNRDFECWTIRRK